MASDDRQLRIPVYVRQVAAVHRSKDAVADEHSVSPQPFNKKRPSEFCGVISFGDSQQWPVTGRDAASHLVAAGRNPLYSDVGHTARLGCLDRNIKLRIRGLRS